MRLYYGTPEDIDKWMELVASVRSSFPGLETQAALDEHRAVVIKFMSKRQAICVKVGDEITVKVMEIDKQGRINLSRKVLLKDEEKNQENKTEE